MNNEPTKEKLFNYLLGTSGETEREAIEDRLFADDDFAAGLDDAENDLIDDYVRGDLSNAQKQRFEQFFLLSERRREKLQLARTLIPELFDKKAITPLIQKREKVSFLESFAAFFRVPSFGLAVGALAVLAILVSGFWFLRPRENNEVVQTNNNINRPTPPIFAPSPLSNQEVSPNSNVNLPSNKPSNPNSNGVSEKSKIQNPKSKIPLPKSTPKVEEPKPLEIPKPIIATILLAPMIRNGESRTLKIAKETKFARLQIVNPERETYQTFRLEIVNAEGLMISRRDFVGKKNPKTLIAQIPAEKLTTGNYEITLSGAKDGENFQDLYYYRFSVEKK